MYIVLIEPDNFLIYTYKLQPTGSQIFWFECGFSGEFSLSLCVCVCVCGGGGGDLSIPFNLCFSRFQGLLGPLTCSKTLETFHTGQNPRSSEPG